MTKLYLPLLAAALFCLITPRSFAQSPRINGCVNSPENPTAILAAVGSAGAIFVSRRRR